MFAVTLVGFLSGWKGFHAGGGFGSGPTWGWSATTTARYLLSRRGRRSGPAKLRVDADSQTGRCGCQFSQMQGQRVLSMLLKLLGQKAKLMMAQRELYVSRQQSQSLIGPEKGEGALRRWTAVRRGRLAQRAVGLGEQQRGNNGLWALPRHLLSGASRQSAGAKMRLGRLQCDRGCCLSLGRGGGRWRRSREEVPRDSE